MATEAPAPAMPAVAGRAAGGAGGNGTASLPPPPRRGQIKGKILKDAIALVTTIALGLVKNTRGGAGGLPASDNADEK
ncbi:hypothetical protein BAE44_0022496 [Dichanthelium oligosanthes]|uniref:Uncharacterized protein n=1 Tax=Dichanthelium oligosanthes TaxID=888268 RepID=A0A1E5UUK6_9POAL|nr:hypothetical protein BAE44_0022496 [Dichanthelium oligosanthes]